MKARELMTDSPACCTPDTIAQDAARLMAQNDCGCIPVVQDQETNRIVGVVTDRDLAMRGLGEGRGPETRVRELMSADPSCCTADSDVDEVARIMTERQVRRVPVVDEGGRCIGMIAQADLARAEGQGVEAGDVGRVVERISEPDGIPRAETDVGVRPARGGGR